MFDWLATYSQLNGAALWLATIVILVIVILLAGRYYAAPGSAKLDAQQDNEREAIAVLKGQLEEQRRLHREQREEDARELREQREASGKEIRQLQDRMALLEERMRIENEWNRDYRHAMANREHILGFAYDAAIEFIDAIIAECPDISTHFLRQRSHMKTATEIRAERPLPVERMVNH